MTDGYAPSAPCCIEEKKSKVAQILENPKTSGVEVGGIDTLALSNLLI